MPGPQRMTDATQDSLASPDTLAEIRREIDRIDEEWEAEPAPEAGAEEAAA